MDALMDSPDERKRRIEMGCKTLGISVAELARRLGKKRQYIYAVMSGATPGEGLWEPMSQVLGVSVQWLTIGGPPFPWWADPARAVVVDVPTMPIPPVPLGPKTEEEAANDDRVLEAMRRMESKIDALMERMDSKPCTAAKPPPVPESWSLEKPRKVRSP